MTTPRRREMSIEQVQQWIITALICAVSSFPIGALIIVTHVNREEDPTGAVMLCVMTAAIGSIRDDRHPSDAPHVALVGLSRPRPAPSLGSAIWTWGF